MPEKVNVKVCFPKKGKIARSDGKWVVRRRGTVDGKSAQKTTICDNLFQAIKESRGHR